VTEFPPRLFEPGSEPLVHRLFVWTIDFEILLRMTQRPHQLMPLTPPSTNAHGLALGVLTNVKKKRVEQREKRGAGREGRTEKGKGRSEADEEKMEETGEKGAETRKENAPQVSCVPNESPNT